MATLANTLYPPVVSTFQNAFVNTQDAVVYFTLSSFNSADDIKRVHISVVDQMTNENALNLSSGLLIEDLMYDTTSGMYYVTIPTTKMQNNYFNVNQFYKVQIRFDAYSGNDVPTAENKKTEYLLENLSYFSEWSSVCLIRPITEPHMRISIFDNYTGDTCIAFNKGQINISGSVYFGNGSSTETETLQSYKIEILEEDEVIQYSPTIYTGENVNPNTINYNIDLSNLSTDVEEYVMRITALTKNQYQFANEYKFKLADYNDDSSWRPTITTELDDERGVVTIHVTNNYSFTSAQTLYIRRASSEDNYSTWENLYVAKKQIIDVTIEDSTVTSHVWYKYKTELANENGVFYANRAGSISSVVFPQFYDALISRAGQQYAIRYNYKISSFKPVVNRTKIDTLGGQYPRFAENAAMNYKQFSITGLMTAESDAYEEFIQRSKVYSGDRINYYKAYKNNSGVEDLVRNDFQNWIKEGLNQYPETEMPSSASQSFLTSTHNDWLWEREFREQLTAWLNDGEPKLYRSMAEGSMAVMITDVSLTPNSTLGRRIWDFSATVYEIADTSIETLDSLGIYETTKLSTITGGGGSVDPSGDDYIDVTKPGQTYTYTVADTNDIRNRILSDLELKYSGVLSDKKPSHVVLKNVKIFFHNQPNPYYFDESGQPQLAPTPTPGGAIDANYKSLINNHRLQNGYVFEVVTSASSGQQVIFVNSRGYYQIPQKLDVKSLSFDHIGDVVTIEYTLCYREYKSASEATSGTSVDRTLVGQEQGVFAAYQYLGESIRSKYSYVKSSKDVMISKQQMQYFKGIRVDVTPNALLNIKYRDAKEYQTYEIGFTGVLDVLNNFEVDELCFIGVRMEKISANRARFADANQYADFTDVAYEKTSDIANPVEHGVYQVGEDKKIYYSSRWYDFTTKNGLDIAAIPVEGTVNYYGSIVVTNYA